MGFDRDFVNGFEEKINFLKKQVDYMGYEC